MSREVCDHLWELDNPTPCPECDAEFKAYMVDFEKIVQNRKNLRAEHDRYLKALLEIATSNGTKYVFELTNIACDALKP